MNDLLIEARRVCVANLSEAAAGGAIVEPALRNADGEVVCDPQGLQTPLRKDVAKNDGNGWLTTNLDTPKVRPRVPVAVIWNACLEISLTAIAWVYVEFRLSPSDVDADWNTVRVWFLKWFDPEDTNQPTFEGFFNVVHFLSDPEEVDGSILLIVDFGSVPIEAFHELLDCFADAGFRCCEIR